MLTTAQRKLLGALYFEISQPSSFSSLNRLYHYAKLKDPNPTILKRDVRDFLNSQQVYLAFRKPTKRARKFAKYYVTQVDDSWSCDTARFPNSMFRFGLVCRDSLSNTTFAKPLKNLKAATVERAFIDIVNKQNRGRFPVRIYTDAGSENRRLATSEAIPSRVTFSKPRLGQKANIAEAAIRAVREKLQRASVAQNRKLDFSKVLPEILHSLNTARQSRLGLSSEEIRKNPGLGAQRKFVPYIEQLQKVRAEALAEHYPKKEYLAPGTRVRLIEPKRSLFEKGTKSRVSAETFTVSDVKFGVPLRFAIVDEENRRVQGLAYRHQLIQVP